MSGGSLKTLKALSRKYPLIDDLLFIIMMNDDKPDQPDRITAIVAGALIDMFLELAIRTKLVPLDIEDGSRLFENNGPLSTMSGRIRMAYALGLYTEPVREELDHIREIRNAFAHSVSRITFDMPEVANVCERLWFPRAYPPDDPKYIRTAQQKFIVSARMCWVLLSDATVPFEHVTSGPFLARAGRNHPELKPWLGKSPQPPQKAPRTSHRKKPKQRVQRRSSQGK